MSNELSIEHINNFEFVAYLPPVFSARPEDAVANSARSAYLKIIEILEASEFYHSEQLRLHIYPKTYGFAIKFEDADYGFEFAFVEDRLVLRRSGGSLERFEAWYRRLMPSLGSLIDSTIRSMEEASEWERIEILRAQFRFTVIAYDFQPLDGDRIVRNSEVVPRLIVAVPGEGGRLVQASESQSPFGRIDYKVSRWVPLPNGSMVREVYDVEAPGNRNYTSVWLTYSVIGETYEADIDERRKFDFDLFVQGNGEDVFADLGEKFIAGFATDLFYGFTFKTASGALP